MVIVIRTIIYYNNLGSRVISQCINNMFYLMLAASYRECGMVDSEL